MKRRELMAVLRLERVSARCVLLLASVEAEEESPPMSMEFDISETSLAWPSVHGSQPGANVEDVDSGWDDAPFREPPTSCNGPSAGLAGPQTT